MRGKASGAGPAPRLLDQAGRPIEARDIARIRARASLSAPGSGVAYDAALQGAQDMADWYPQLRSPDAEISGERDRIAARHRDLIRNDGWATGGLNRTLDAMIGASFLVNVRPDTRALRRLDRRLDGVWAAEFAAEAEAQFGLYANDPNRYCDAARKLTLTQMLRLAARHKMVDGDALGVLLWAPERMGVGAAHFATTLQLVHPDRLCNPDDGPDTATLRGGVELDALEAPVAYHIRRGHRSDWYASADAMVWDRFPRETPWGRPIVVHDHDVEGAGQSRGVGVLTPVLSRFKMLAKFDQASLQAAVLRALVGFFIKSPYDPQEVQDSLDVMKLPDGSAVPEGLFAYNQLREQHRALNPVTLGGVRIGTLAPGEELQTVSAGAQAVEFETFEHAFLRCVAAAIGSSAEEVTNDYRRVNYSSARAALVVAWRTLMRRRADFAIGFATPIYTAWLEEAVVERNALPLPAGALPPHGQGFRRLLAFAEHRAAFARCHWIGPGRGWVDPTRERQGELLGLQAGFGTLAQTVAEISGGDWRQVLEQRAVEEAEMRRLGLTLPDWAGGGREAPAPEVEREREEQDV